MIGAREPVTSDVATSVPAAGGDGAATVGARLEALYETISREAMRDLPICNPVLRVEAVGFREDAERIVGVLATPWFMNLVVAAAPGGALPPASAGATVTHAFPGGAFDCVVGETAGFGRLDSASLFSPMFQFDDPAVVRAVAEAAIEEVFRPAEDPDATAKAASPAALDRRALLFGRRPVREGPSCR